MPALSNAFDWEIYVQCNPLLAEKLSGYEIAHGHWEKIGRSRKLVATEEDFYTFYKLKKSDLPDDFSWEEYLECNPDVKIRMGAKWTAIKHYLCYGKFEQREYSLLRMGTNFLQQQQWSKAVNAFQYAVKLNLSSVDVFFSLGEALSNMHRWNEAEQSYQQALKLDPNHIRSLKQLGIALIAQKRWLDAELIFERVLQQDPNSLGAYLNLGEALLHQEKYEKAVLALQHATKLDSRCFQSNVTFDRILEWANRVETTLHSNEDYLYLDKVFKQNNQLPSFFINKKDKPLRILTYRWHCPHQYELYRIGHDFTLVTGLGTRLCEKWDFGKRPLPANAQLTTIGEINPKDYDIAILHFDEAVLHPEKCLGRVPDDWGKTFKWFMQNLDNVPKVAICHGTPQFAGQYDANYIGSDLGTIDDKSRQELVDFMGEVLVICNSHQAQREWNFKQSQVIWHGFSPHDYPVGEHNSGVLCMPFDALRNRPHYNGLHIFNQVMLHLNKKLDINFIKVSQPHKFYTRDTQDWAISKYQNYVREVGKFSVYFNPTLRSPMPRTRGEAMMAGLISVSMQNHDVDMFIRNGFNGFYSQNPEELSEYLVYLHENPGVGEEMGKQARLTAMDVFNQDRYLSEWSTLLQDLSN